jgi:hypothetical protein
MELTWFWGFCEDCIEPLDPIQRGEFTDDYQFRKRFVLTLIQRQRVNVTVTISLKWLEAGRHTQDA